MATRRAPARMVQRLRNQLPGVQVFVVGIDQAVAPEGLAIIPESVTPARLPDVFPSEEVSSSVLRFHINICGPRLHERSLGLPNQLWPELGQDDPIALPRKRLSRRAPDPTPCPRDHNHRSHCLVADPSA